MERAERAARVGAIGFVGLAGWYAQPSQALAEAQEQPRKTRVVILGSGFAAVSFLRGLDLDHRARHYCAKLTMTGNLHLRSLLKLRHLLARRSE